MLYTIGEMAKTLGIPTSTLRFYDKKGLLPFVERSSGGIRMFTSADMEFLKIIECLKASGLSLDEIGGFMQLIMRGDETINERLELFKQRLAEVERQIEELRKIHDMLEYKCWYYEIASIAGTTAVHDTMTEEEIPKRFLKIKRKLSEG